MKNRKIKVGDLYPVWWETYEGLFAELFNAVLRLSPNTYRGWIEMAVKV